MSNMTREQRAACLSFLPKPTVFPSDLEGLSEKVVQILSRFECQVKVPESGVAGPRVARLPLVQGPVTRLRTIRALLPDLAVRLGVPSVRLSTNAGLSLEVPLKECHPVSLSNVLTEAAVQGMELPWAVGLAVDGSPVVRDLATAPHVLISGVTGSGKSAALTSLLVSLMLTTHPEDCEIVLIDTKRVDVAPMAVIPHVRQAAAATPEAALETLESLVAEMRHRYTLLEALEVSNLTEFNAIVVAKGGEALRRIVVVIDELADLMVNFREEAEGHLITLAQLARAAGIHLVCATQRPSAQVVSTQLRSQLPTRLAFAVASATDSRVALDEPGAEKLLGSGDALCKWAGQQPIRLQGTLVDQPWRDYLTWKVFHDIYNEKVWERDISQAYLR